MDLKKNVQIIEDIIKDADDLPLLQKEIETLEKAKQFLQDHIDSQYICPILEETQG